MSKPTKSRLWDQDDISDVKGCLPDGVSFGTLAGGGTNGFKLDLGHGQPVDGIVGKTSVIAEKLRDIGVSVEGMTLTAGYCGTNSPHLLLEIQME